MYLTPATVSQQKTVEYKSAAVKRKRTSIGLVLGSGAARGFAHIGVIRSLRAHGIIPDIVVGTSMGALVGGCYAIDQLDQLETWARKLSLRRVISYLDVALNGRSFINGARLAADLEQSIGSTTINDLPIRFAAIATEVGTGHEVWLTRGSLVLALRASYAMPGVFPAVAIGRKWLVDGALVNPVPVSVARAFGARMVIAVNVNADRFGRGATITSHGAETSERLEASDGHAVALQNGSHNRLDRLRRMFGPEHAPRSQTISGAKQPSFLTIMIDSFNIMQDRLTRMRLAGDPPDVHITPRVSHVGWLDFHRAADAIKIGQAATDEAMASIKEMIVELS
jgi:NTE family protein